MLGGCHIKPEQFFNLIFGYYDRYAAQGSDLNPGAGPLTKTLPAVPAGEIWVVQMISASNQSRACTMMLGANLGGIDVWAYRFVGGAAGDWAVWSGQIVLKQDDYIEVYFANNQAGDDLYWRAAGYKMKLSQ